ncbi:MAG: hypothetical protein ABI867_04935 [Kofleriaceae bacterium]
MMRSLGPGDEVGRYRLIGPHPGGGFRALHMGDQQRVVIDVREVAGDWRDRAVQLLRATSLLAALDHPGIGRIVDRGVLPDRRPWIASELAEGVTVSEILARRTLAVDETLALIRDLATIATHVHARGLVHTAIHPHAITVCTGERAFAIQLGAWSELRTTGSEPAGRPTPYVAPERSAQPASDIFSIGVLAYRALTGRFPSAALELVAGVPGVVSALVVRMLATEPELRPEAVSVQRVATDLTGDRVLSGPRFARPRWTPPPIASEDRIASIDDLAYVRSRY